MDYSLSLVEWQGMDHVRLSVLELDSSVSEKLFQVMKEEAILFDELLDKMLDEFLGARNLGQVQTDSERDVPRSDSSAACGS
jgi:hypothetical protein